MKQTVSANKAITLGLIVVNGPILPLMIGIPIIFFMLVVRYDLPIMLFFLSIFLGFIMAWAWWSYSLPKWRLWAIQQVENIPGLYNKAVKVGLMWPRGHFFEKTELKSLAHTIQENEIELAYTLSSLQQFIEEQSPELMGVATELLNQIEMNSNAIIKLESAQKMNTLLIQLSSIQEGENQDTSNYLIFILEHYIELLEKI